MKHKQSLFKKFSQKLGPGFISGAADDDPSGIATYAQTGAQFGLTQLWTPLFSLPFMITVQEMCGRIGLVTGDGLSGVIKKHFSKTILYGAVGLLFVANAINIGADLGAMAAVSQLIVPTLPLLPLLIGFATLILILEIFVSYARYSQFLKYFALSLLAYVASALLVPQNWKTVLYHTVIPQISFTKEFILNIVAILGTTISPYLFFWQAAEEAEEEVATGAIKEIGGKAPRVTKKNMRLLHTDTIAGMLFSNLIMFFIIATGAATLHAQGITSVDTAAQAAEALRPIAGDFAFLLFMFGVIGTGLLAVPILAGSAAYAISEAAGWKTGLSLSPRAGSKFYGIIALSLFAGIGVNFLGIPPFRLLYYTAALNGIVAPILIVLILIICNNKKIMGSYINSPLQNILGVAIALIMSIAATALLVTSF